VSVQAAGFGKCELVDIDAGYVSGQEIKIDGLLAGYAR
jgi:hypothetical protein